LEGHYFIRVSDPKMSFSAAHFVLTSDGLEPLHGHNYSVSVEVKARLGTNGMVADFRDIKRVVRGVCGELDHRILLPKESDSIELDVHDTTVEVRHKDRRYLFPKEDCVLLPIRETTAELLAGYIAERMVHMIETVVGDSFEYTVCVSETGGCEGCARRSLSAPRDSD